MTKKEKEAYIIKSLTELTDDVFYDYHTFMEEEALKGGYDKETGRKVLKSMVKKKLEGKKSEETKKENKEELTTE